MRQVVIATIVILATLGGLLLVWQLRLGVVLFLFSLAVAAMLRPAIHFGMRRGLSRGLAIAVTYLLLLLGLGGLLVLISGKFILEIQQITNAMADRYEAITQTWPQGTQFQQTIAEQLPPPEDLYSAFAGERGTELLQNFLGIAQSVFGFTSQLVIVLILSIYWSADRMRFEQLWLSLLPVNRRRPAREVWREIESGVGAYLRSELVQSILAGLILGIGYWLIGLPYPVTLAVLSALLWLIPWVGAVLALIAPLLVGLQGGLALGLGSAILTLIVLLFLEFVVEPRFFIHHRYSSLLTVIMMTALADSFGLFGLVIAPPFAAAIQLAFNSIVRWSPAEAQASPSTQILTLQARIAEISERVENGEVPASPEIENLVDRLSELVEETGEVFEEEDGVQAPPAGASPRPAD